MFNANLKFHSLNTWNFVSSSKGSPLGSAQRKSFFFSSYFITKASVKKLIVLYWKLYNCRDAIYNDVSAYARHCSYIAMNRRAAATALRVERGQLSTSRSINGLLRIPFDDVLSALIGLFLYLSIVTRHEKKRYIQKDILL